MVKHKKKFPNPSRSQTPFCWTPTSKYPDLIRNACDNYGFEFSDNEIHEFEKELLQFPMQEDNLFPVSVAVWPSKNSVDSLNNWLIDQARQQGEIIGLYIIGMNLSFTNKSFKYRCGQPVLRPVIIDLIGGKAKYLNEDGSWREQDLGIEIVPFLALNPHVVKMLDYKTLPNIRVPGVRMNGNLELVIGYNDGFTINFESV